MAFLDTRAMAPATYRYYLRRHIALFTIFHPSLTPLLPGDSVPVWPPPAPRARRQSFEMRPRRGQERSTYIFTLTPVARTFILSQVLTRASCTHRYHRRFCQPPSIKLDPTGPG